MVYITKQIILNEYFHNPVVSDKGYNNPPKIKSG